MRIFFYFDCYPLCPHPICFAGQIPTSFVYLGQTNDKFVEGEFLQHWVWAGTRKVIRLQPITYSIVLILKSGVKHEMNEELQKINRNRKSFAC